MNSTVKDSSVVAVQIFDQRKFKRKQDQGFLGVINLKVSDVIDLELGGQGKWTNDYHDPLADSQKCSRVNCARGLTKSLSKANLSFTFRPRLKHRFRTLGPPPLHPALLSLPPPPTLPPQPLPLPALPPHSVRLIPRRLPLLSLKIRHQSSQLPLLLFLSLRTPMQRPLLHLALRPSCPLLKQLPPDKPEPILLPGTSSTPTRISLVRCHKDGRGVSTISGGSTMSTTIPVPPLGTDRAIIRAATTRTRRRARRKLGRGTTSELWLMICWRYRGLARVLERRHLPAGVNRL